MASAASADGVQGQAAAVALVGERRIDIAVGDHDAARGQGGPHHLGHVLGAVGEVQERLGARGHARARRGSSRSLADPRPDGGASRLLGDDRVRPKRLGQEPRLGALPAAFDALERDERHEPARSIRVAKRAFYLDATPPPALGSGLLLDPRRPVALVTGGGRGIGRAIASSSAGWGRRSASTT